MSFNIQDYRNESSFKNINVDERSVVLSQAIRTFDMYQRYMPNTHRVYINGNDKFILGTMQDITDLELRTDTKYMLTSLKNKVNQGDVVKWGDINYLCIYDKIKTTGTCYKVKIQPCNAELKFMAKDESGNYKICREPIITNVYYTDIRDENNPIPWSSDLYGLSIQYNNYTSQLTKQSRIFLYGGAWEIVGIDYTNINTQTNKGFYRYMIKATDMIKDLDNEVEEVCDYYKYTPKVIDVEENKNDVTINKNISLHTNVSKIRINDTIRINSDVDATNYIFEFAYGRNIGCKIDNITKEGFDLITGSSFGTISVNALSNVDRTLCGSIVLKIGQ